MRKINIICLSILFSSFCISTSLYAQVKVPAATNLLSPAGPVGIGTLTPTEALDIKTGTIRLQKYSSTNRAQPVTLLGVDTMGNIVPTVMQIVSHQLNPAILDQNTVNATGPVMGYWSLTGNEITENNYIGSTNNMPVRFYTNGSVRMVLQNDKLRTLYDLQVDGSAKVQNNLIVEGTTNIGGVLGINNHLDIRNGNFIAHSSSAPSKLFAIYGNTDTRAGASIEMYDKDYTTNTAMKGMLAFGTYATDASNGNVTFTRYNGTSYVESMRITGDGRVRIGTESAVLGPNTKLGVDGMIAARELKLVIGNFPDYVFAKDYSLMSLNDLKTYINENSHLPGIPSAKEVEADNGVELGKLNAKLLEKVEELTLYTIQLHEELEQVKAQLAKQNK